MRPSWSLPFSRMSKPNCFSLSQGRSVPALQQVHAFPGLSDPELDTVLQEGTQRAETNEQNHLS